MRDHPPLSTPDTAAAARVTRRGEPPIREVTSNIDTIDIRKFRRRFAYVATRALCAGTGWKITVED